MLFFLGPICNRAKRAYAGLALYLGIFYSSITALHARRCFFRILRFQLSRPVLACLKGRRPWSVSTPPSQLHPKQGCRMGARLASTGIVSCRSVRCMFFWASALFSVSFCCLLLSRSGTLASKQSAHVDLFSTVRAVHPAKTTTYFPPSKEMRCGFTASLRQVRIACFQYWPSIWPWNLAGTLIEGVEPSALISLGETLRLAMMLSPRPEEAVQKKTVIMSRTKNPTVGLCKRKVSVSRK